MIDFDDLGPGCGDVTVVAGIGGGYMPQILALCAGERGEAVTCVTAGRYALENAGDMAALAVDVLMRTGDWEASRKMVESLRSGSCVDTQHKQQQEMCQLAYQPGCCALYRRTVAGSCLRPGSECGGFNDLHSIILSD